MSKISQVPTDEIKAGNNDRKNFNQAELIELAQSINEHGLAQPITLRKVSHCPSCGYNEWPLLERDMCPNCDAIGLTVTFQIVAGERRFRAISQVLGWSTIPAIIRDINDEAVSAIMLAENTSRSDLNPIEEGNAYKARIERFGWSISKIAKIAGVSDSLVKSRIDLLNLNVEIQRLVSSGQFPIGHAQILTDLDSNRQRIATKIYNESSGLAFRTFRGIVNQLLEEQSQDNLFDLESFWVEQVKTGAEFPRRGKKAITNAPVSHTLPPVKLLQKSSTADIIDNYIADLITTGHNTAAQTIGTLYTALVHGNFMSVPIQSALA